MFTFICFDNLHNETFPAKEQLISHGKCAVAPNCFEPYADENVKRAQHQNGGELNTREVGVAIRIHTHRGEFTFDCLLLSLTS